MLHVNSCGTIFEHQRAPSAQFTCNNIFLNSGCRKLEHSLDFFLLYAVSLADALSFFCLFNPT